MKRFILLILGLASMTACSKTEYFEEYGTKLAQPMTFQVREVSLDEIVANDPSMQVRKELIEKEDNEIVVGSEDEDLIYKVNTDLLNVRESANTEADIVDKLSAESEVRVLESLTDEEGQNWAKISADGIEGYVVSDYLTSGPVDAPISTYRSVIYQLNIRSAPSEDSEVVGELGYFEQFDVYEKVETDDGLTWLKTKLASGDDAYVISDYCVEVDD